MKRFTLYSLMSLGVFLSVVGTTFHSHRQFYPSMVSLSQSRLFNVLMTNSFAVVIVSAFKVVKFVFLGALRDQEVEKVMENSAYYLMELFLALTVFGERYTIKTVALFVMCIFWKVFHWLAQSRLEFIEQTPAIGTGQARLAIFVALLVAVDSAAGRSLAEEMLTHGLSVKLLLLQEFMVMTLMAMSSLARLLLHLFDARRQTRWEYIGDARFYLQIVTDLLQCLIYIGFFATIYMHHGLPINLLREMFVTIRNLYRTIRNFMNYRNLAANLDLQFPDATEEEVAQDPNCSICIDEMPVGEAKKLHCGHIFHRHCLRQWLERQTTCPYCRQSIGNTAANLQAREERAAAAAARDAAGREGGEEGAAGGEAGVAGAGVPAGGAAGDAAAPGAATATGVDGAGVGAVPERGAAAVSSETELQEAYSLYCQAFETAPNHDTWPVGGFSNAPPHVAGQTATSSSSSSSAGASAVHVSATMMHPSLHNLLFQPHAHPAAAAPSVPNAPSLAEATAYQSFHTEMAKAYENLARSLENAKEKSQDKPDSASTSVPVASTSSNPHPHCE